MVLVLLYYCYNTIRHQCDPPCIMIILTLEVSVVFLVL